ncbi:MAG: ABC transporter ATP-binding protein [Candidatus Bathyarchaeia archaeon]
MVKLKLLGVEFYYGSSKVLEEISFSFEKGEIVGIIGPNGAGKTTLLRTISGILKPYKGSVLIDDRHVHSMDEKEIAKELGMVKQDQSIGFSFTALEIVLMGRNPYLSRFQLEGSKDFEVAKEAMEITGTWHLANRSINEVSGGERQKIIIARALAQMPKILLLDEPTLHLDINNQLEIMELLKRLCVKNDLLILMAMHDFNLAANYCKKLMLLDKGRIVSIGKPEEVLTEENIFRVFKVRVIPKRHPVTNSLFIIPFQQYRSSKEKCGFIVHLICGGGTGAALMRELTDIGLEVTAGVLNALDSDLETAELLKIPTVIDAPFSSISDEAYKENLRLIEKADLVVVSEFPVGVGNLRNLEVVIQALKKKPVIMLNNKPIELRDFTKGIAKELFHRIVGMGAILANDVEEIRAMVKDYIKRKQSNNLVH